MKIYRKLYLYLKYYLHKPSKKDYLNAVICVIDQRANHPGLVDRLKTIVSAYYIAKKNNMSFKIFFSHPFELTDYLVPNEYSWICSEDDIEYSLKSSRILTSSNLNNGKLDVSKQYHVYGGSFLSSLIPLDEIIKVWGNLFSELFKPSPSLHSELDKIGEKENSFIALHLRFVNLLDFFEPSEHHKTLPDDEKEKLIKKCLGTIQSISEEENMPLMVFSDSNIFLNRVKALDGVKTIDGEIEHISFLNSKSNVMKTFLDFYMMSMAKEVHSIIYPDMYKSAFPAFAAWSKKKAFYRIVSVR